MRSDTDGGLKASVVRERYRSRVEALRVEADQSESAVSDAMQKLREVQAGGDAEQLRTALHAALNQASVRVDLLDSQARETWLDPADRVRLESERDRARQELEKLSSEQQSAPLERSAQADALEAGTAESDYRDDLEQFGSGSRTDADLDRESAALTSESGADGAIAAGDSGGLAKSRTADQRSRVAEQLAQAEVQGGVYQPSPELEAAYLQESGALSRTQILGEGGGADAVRAELSRTITEMIDGLRARYAAASTGVGMSDSERAEIELEFQRQLQPMLDQQARLTRETERSEYARLPDLTVGGTSFSMRYLPSAAQSASELTRDGLQPLNAGVGGAPVPVKLVGGEIAITVHIPGIGKAVAKRGASSVEKGSQTVRLRSHYPGV